MNNKCVVQIEIYDKHDQIAEFFSEIGYTNFFKIGPDHYFSNNDVFCSADRILNIVEAAIGELTQLGLNG